MRLQSTVLCNSWTSMSPLHENGSDIIRNCDLRFILCSYWVVSYDPTPTSVCVLMMKYSFVCSVLSGNLACLPGRRQMFTVFCIFRAVRQSDMFIRQEADVYCSKLWSLIAFCSYWLLSYHHSPTPICILMCKYIAACAWGAGMFTPVCVLMMKYVFACSVLLGKLTCLPSRRQMFTMVNYGLQQVNP
ncbi:hypothetical protein Cgig2_015751 [Carnegiea gigantea]|uniref:Uncharacterized protein n=1 Tax=Carnegiea gigantea TaxID=171969 RepID=A0A9Q1JPJ0_9CARY|nr:hypothetical protein Cgig2_015751 [Carnegiea gigantea]